MARYIDAEKLIEHLKETIKECGIPNVDNRPIAYGTVLGLKGALSYAETLPTADVAEVKHGEWKREDNEVCYWYVCSECRDEIPRNKYGGWSFPNYCPNCGAKMDGDDNE